MNSATPTAFDRSACGRAQQTEFKIGQDWGGALTKSAAIVLVAEFETGRATVTGARSSRGILVLAYACSAFGAKLSDGRDVNLPAFHLSAFDYETLCKETSNRLLRLLPAGYGTSRSSCRAAATGSVDDRSSAQAIG
jgi:hypothetical protein